MQRQYNACMFRVTANTMPVTTQTPMKGMKSNDDVFHFSVHDYEGKVRLTTKNVTFFSPFHLEPTLTHKDLIDVHSDKVRKNRHFPSVVLYLTNV